jgi:hypothetical protein
VLHPSFWLRHRHRDLIRGDHFDSICHERDYHCTPIVKHAVIVGGSWDAAILLVWLGHSQKLRPETYLSPRAASGSGLRSSSRLPN